MQTWHNQYVQFIQKSGPLNVSAFREFRNKDNVFWCLFYDDKPDYAIITGGGKKWTRNFSNLCAMLQSLCVSVSDRHPSWFQHIYSEFCCISKQGSDTADVVRFSSEIYVEGKNREYDRTCRYSLCCVEKWQTNIYLMCTVYFENRLIRLMSLSGKWEGFKILEKLHRQTK